MSLSRFALRLAAVRCLRGATLAADRVFDSMTDPIDNRLSADPQPIISVYTDDQSDQISGRGDMAGQNPVVDLVFEVAIAQKTTVQVDGEDFDTVEVPDTDAGMELLLDVLERQVVGALTTNQGAWSSIWRTFCTNIPNRVSRRGVFGGTGGRFAARQITLSIETLLDPPKGAAHTATSAWARLLDALDSTPDLAPIAAIIRTELGVAAVSETVLAASYLGADINVAEGLGLGAMSGPGENAALLTAASVAIGVYIPPPAADPEAELSPQDAPSRFSLLSLIDSEPGNALRIGDDGKLFTPDVSPGPGFILVGSEVRLAISTLPQG